MELTPYRIAKIKNADRPKPPKLKLTRRERQVLDLMVAGLRVSAVSEHLGISVKTVSSYVTRMRSGVGLTGRHSDVRFAILAYQRGWITL